MNFLNDPIVGQLLAQNPKAKLIATNLQAHVAEHLGFKYSMDIQKRVGAPLPKPDSDLPEDMELEVSRLIAQASSQLSQNNMEQVAQQKAQQKAQDPIIQMQQQELAIKAQDAVRKARKIRQMLLSNRLKLWSKKDCFSGTSSNNPLAAATDDAKLEEKQSGQVVKALVEEQKIENQADNAIAQTILQQAVNQPDEQPTQQPPTPTEEPKE